MVAAGRIAAAPISWGVCEVPGWGHQMAPQRVLAEIRELGFAAAEFGPPGFLPLDPAAVLFEDYHLITSSAVHQAMAFLVEHSPGGLEIAVSTRHDPPLPLARLRARRPYRGDIGR